MKEDARLMLLYGGLPPALLASVYVIGMRLVVTRTIGSVEELDKAFLLVALSMFCIGMGLSTFIWHRHIAKRLTALGIDPKTVLD